MKRETRLLFAILIIGVLAVGIVSAVNDSNKTNRSNGIGSGLSSQIAEKRTEFKSGNFTTSLGKFLAVKQIVAGMLEIREGNSVAKTKLNITKVENNESKVEVDLGNGKRTELKIMPSTASETALAKLRIKVCNETNNCTIELKEVPVGNGNKTIEYNVQIERHARILGIFQAKMKASEEVDAETGEVIAEHKPWWAFIATQPLE